MTCDDDAQGCQTCGDVTTTKLEDISHQLDHLTHIILGDHRPGNNRLPTAGERRCPAGNEEGEDLLRCESEEMIAAAHKEGEAVAQSRETFCRFNTQLAMGRRMLGSC